jgi:hypothetical protein
MTTNLNYLCESYRLSNGIVSTQYDQQFLQWAIDGMIKMKQMGLLPEVVKAVELPINKENNTADLPEDYDFDSLIRMGVCRNGTFIQFDKNDTLCLPHETGCKCPSSEDIATGIDACCNSCGGEGFPSWAYPIYGQPYSYSYTVNNYAIGAGYYHGGYMIDYSQRLIKFDKCITVDTCVLEYFGNVTNDGGNALVSEGMREVLINWIHYCRCRFSPDANMRREMTSAKSTWYQSVRDFNSTQNAMDKFQWLNLIRRYVYQAPKS